MIDILFLVGVLLTILRAIDLFLIKEQQDRITTAIEDLTIIAELPNDYLRENNINTDDVRLTIFVCCLFMSAIFFCVAMSIISILELSFVPLTKALSSSVLAVLAFAMLWNYPLKSLARIGSADGTRGGRKFFFLIGCLVVSVFGLFPFMILCHVALGWGPNEFETHFGLAPFVLLMGLVMANEAIDEILRRSRRFTDFHLAAMVLKPMLWRIVNYSKGPFAGIVLIATVFLGIYKIIAT